MHVHVVSPDGEAKFWLEPAIEVARNYNLGERDVQRARDLIEEHEDEIREAWNRHFGSGSH